MSVVLGTEPSARMQCEASTVRPSVSATVTTSPGFKPAAAAAKVILNARTGSVVMNQAVTLDTCAISHGNLSVTIGADTNVSQPAPGSRGQTAVTTTPSVEIKKDPGKVLLVKGGASLAEVVKAMNSIGASPQDLLAILQALKAAGSLRAELEII